MNDLGSLIDEFKAHIAALVAAAVLALKLRKKISSDNVDVATDEQRRKWIDAIVLERDDLRQENRDLRDQRAKDAENLGRFTAELSSCRTEIDRLKQKIERLERMLDRRHDVRELSLGRRNTDEQGFEPSGF